MCRWLLHLKFYYPAGKAIAAQIRLRQAVRRVRRVIDRSGVARSRFGGTDKGESPQPKAYMVKNE